MLLLCSIMLKSDKRAIMLKIMPARVYYCTVHVQYRAARAYPILLSKQKPDSKRSKIGVGAKHGLWTLDSWTGLWTEIWTGFWTDTQFNDDHFQP